MIPDDIAMLNGETWFSGLSANRRSAILGQAIVQSAPAGTRVYRLGDPPNGLYALLEGKMRMVSYTATGMELVGMILRPGLWFGELSVLDGKERPHDAIADTAVRLAHLSMSALVGLTSADPEMWRDIAILSCQHQRMGLRHTARIQTQSAIVRLAGFLLGTAAASPDTVVRLTQEDLAQIVGVSRQRINKLLGELQRRSLVQAVYGGVAICNAAGLRAFVGAAEEVQPEPAVIR